MIVVHFMDIGCCTAETYASCVSLLPGFMRDQTASYVKEADRKRYVLGKLILRNMLMGIGYHAGILSQVKSGSNNRPYLDDAIDFNISHSGSYVVCVLSDNTKVGIDVEEIKELKIDDIKASVLTEEEYRAVEAAAAPLAAFYEIWTLKEAALKANGAGLMLPVKDVVIRSQDVQCAAESWNYQALQIHPAYKCHLVYKGKDSIIVHELSSCPV